MAKDNSATVANKQNQIIYDTFVTLAKYAQIELDLAQDQKTMTALDFRLRNYKYVIKLLSRHAAVIKSGKDLLAYPRIGPKTVQKIDEILASGKLEELETLKRKYKKIVLSNNIVNELTQVVGIGRVTALELIDKYKIKSLADLQSKVARGDIEINEKIQMGLKYVDKFKGNIPRTEMNEIHDFLYEKITSIPFLTMTMCGSYRRGLPTSNDIDILLCHLDLLTMDDVKESSLLKDVVKVLKKHKFIKDDLAGDDITTKYMGFCQFKKNPVRRIDIRLVPFESYFPALIYFTGSYELNRIMRSNAKKLGYKLNEYGLYKGNSSVYIESEEDLFDKLNMEYLPPQERNII